MIKKNVVFGGADFIDEIVNSSAIPFVFHGYSIANSKVDGGLLNNLPTDALPDNGGSKIAIVFSSDRRETPRSLTSYIKTLVDIVIDTTVERGRSGAGIHVVPLDTELGMFEFDKAVQFIDSVEYKHLRRQAQDGVEKIIIKLETERRNRIPDDVTREELDEIREKYASDLAENLTKLQTIHYSLRQNVETRVQKKTVEFICLNLQDENAHSRSDICSVEDQVSPSAPMHVYGASLAADGPPVHTKDFVYSVVDAHMEPRSATQVGVPGYFKGPINTPLDDVMLFFSPPLAPSDGPFTIKWKNPVKEVLFDILSEKQQDFIVHACKEAESIGELFLLCQIPRKFAANLQLADDTTYKSPGSKWVSGTRATDVEIARLQLPLPEAGMIRIGWRVKNLVQGNECGFRAYIKP